MGGVLKLEQNKIGRDFVIADIHGCFEFVDLALEKIEFNPEQDRLISLGDLINRGPDSLRCLEFLSRPYVYAIQGNHEVGFQNSFPSGAIPNNAMEDKWYHDGNAGEWLQPYISDKNTPQISEIIKAFEPLPYAIEIETDRGLVGFVHAEIPLNMDWDIFKQALNSGDRETIRIATEGRARFDNGDASIIKGIGRLFAGHSPSKYGPTRLGNTFYMDAGAYNRFFKLDKGFQGYLSIANIEATTTALLKNSQAKMDSADPVITITDYPQNRLEPFKDFSLEQPEPLHL